MGSKKKEKKDPHDSTMSLGDHLEELRARLILAILGLAIGAAVCLIFGKKIIHFIERPYLNAVKSVIADPDDEGPLSDSNDIVTAFCANLIAELAGDPNAPEIDPEIVKFVQKVYTETMATAMEAAAEELAEADNIPSSHRLMTLAPTDGFVSYMKISLMSGLVLSAPWVFYQLWMFVAAGLYHKERKYVHVAVPFSVVLFITGALFFIVIVAPLAMQFLMRFNKAFLGVNSAFTFKDYISFVTLLMLVFGVAFQTPIAIMILTKTGLVSIAAMKRSRKYVFLGVFVIAAIATPPDVVSQVTLAIPLYILFELGLVLSYFWGRKKKKDDEESAPSEMDVY